MLHIFLSWGLNRLGTFIQQFVPPLRCESFNFHVLDCSFYSLSKVWLPSRSRELVDSVLLVLHSLTNTLLFFSTPSLFLSLPLHPPPLSLFVTFPHTLSLFPPTLLFLSEGESSGELGPPPSVDEAANTLMTRLGFLLGDETSEGPDGEHYSMDEPDDRQVCVWQSHNANPSSLYCFCSERKTSLPICDILRFHLVFLYF